MSIVDILTLLTQLALFVLALTLVTRTGPIALTKRIADQIIRGVTGAPVKRLSQISPQLYVGGQHSERGLDKLGAMGITAIVNMREAEYDDAKNGIALDRYLHLPTIDGTAPTIEDLQRGIDFITQEIEQGGTVYIHCASGFHRAPTMTIAYLISTGITFEAALAAVKKVRPFARPIKVQVAQLKHLESELNKK